VLDALNYMMFCKGGKGDDVEATVWKVARLICKLLSSDDNMKLREMVFLMPSELSISCDLPSM
jgi:hypothetical protein